MPMDEGSDRRKESFDRVADAYAAFRPAPPREVIDAIVTASTLRRGSRVLEIGCGTGQLSVPLAEFGVEVVAIELGPHLAALAERNLERFPQARVLVSSFEEWQVPVRRFDAVICASAFHWLDGELRYSKCAAALRPGGALTILQVHYVRGGTTGFFADTQPYYRRWGLSDDPTFELPDPNELPPAFPELDRRIEFSAVERSRFEIPMRYTTDSYIGWLRTDSLVNSVDDESRAGFLDDMERLISRRYDGAVVRNLVYELIVARRAS
jgi:SAM-dependent methyltransferase